jgi:pimeloyl-ACP methyl ester carboxylesterase
MPFANDLYYTVYEGGNENQIPVILLHGAGSNHLCWPVDLRCLPGQCVYALDLPAHGRSGGIGLQTIRALAERVMDFLHDIGQYRAVFIGHSMGGAVALQLAVDQPEHVSGVGLISSAACFSIPPGLLMALSSPITQSEGLTIFKQHAFGSDVPQGLMAKSMQQILQLRPGVLYADWLACSRFDLRDRLGEVKAPVWAVCGQEDYLTPPSNLRYLHNHLQSIQMEIFPEADHMVMIEKPHQVAKGLEGFLGGINMKPAVL